MAVWASNYNKKVQLSSSTPFVYLVTNLMKLTKFVYSAFFSFNFWINLLFCKSFFEAAWESAFFWTVRLLLECDGDVPVRQKWKSCFSSSQPLFFSLTRAGHCLGSLHAPCTGTWCGDGPWHQPVVFVREVSDMIPDMIPMPLAYVPSPSVGEQCWGISQQAIKELVPSAVNDLQPGWPSGFI